MFLLARKDYIAPGMFICPADSDGIPYVLLDNNVLTIMDFSDMFNCSYSLSYPWGNNVTWNMTGKSDFITMSDLSPIGITGADVTQADESGNSKNHNEDGQNALTLGGGVKWGETNEMGIGGDNIFTYGGGSDSGTAPGDLSANIANSADPANTSDSVMIFYDRKPNPNFP